MRMKFKLKAGVVFGGTGSTCNGANVCLIVAQIVFPHEMQREKDGQTKKTI